MNAAEQANETAIENGMEMSRGSRVVKITKQSGLYTVYAGIRGTNCPGDELIPARHFKGHTTCSQDFRTANNAIRAANKFLGFHL